MACQVLGARAARRTLRFFSEGGSRSKVLLTVTCTASPGVVGAAGVMPSRRAKRAAQAPGGG